MTPAPHLNEAAQAMLRLPDKDRLQTIRQARWIGYSRAKELLNKFDGLLNHPRVQRMPNLLVVGETNNGKSVLVNRFQHLHPASENRPGEGVMVPVLLIQAPPVPDELRFYHSILEALASPYRPHESAAKKMPQVLRLLRTIGLRMLIIDEIHHILAGHISKQQQMLNVLKYLGNELQIPLVGVGTKDALRAIQTDPQMANRFEPAALPRWDLNREFLMLLASFERVLPLRKPSRLWEQPLAARLLALSEGTIGELSSLLAAAVTRSS